MTLPSTEQPRWFQWLKRRVGDPRKWRDTDKALGTACVAFPFRLSNLIAALFASRNLSAHPQVNPSFVPTWIGGLITIDVFWLLMILTGVVLRKRSLESRLYVVVVVAGFWITNSAGSYALGVTTAPFWVSLVGGALLMMIGFGARLTYIGLGLSALTITVLMLLSHWDVLPYAPLINPRYLPPDSLKQGGWMIYMTATSAVLALVVVLVGQYMLLQWSEYEQQLQVLSSTDALTSLLNRRAFLESCETEMHRTTRYGLPLSLAMIDIDHFKSINDTHGHQAGDEALRAVAKTLHECFRSHDVVGRLGGEEFAVLLPHTDRAGALVAAERFRSAIEAQSFALKPTLRTRLSVTIGIASLGLSEKDTLDALMHRADGALYSGKHAGRNRICLADEPWADTDASSFPAA